LPVFCASDVKSESYKLHNSGMFLNFAPSVRPLAKNFDGVTDNALSVTRHLSTWNF